MIPADFFFANPLAAYLFLSLPVLLIIFWWYWQNKQKRQNQIITQDSTVQGTFPSNLKELYLYGCFLLSIFFAIFAVMMPKGNGEYPPSLLKDQQLVEGRMPAHEIAFYLDVSSSMNSLDAQLKQSRLDDGRIIIDQIVQKLRGETASLSVFTSTSELIVPPTLDQFYFRLILRNTKIDQNDVTGTSIKMALENYKQKVEEDPYNKNRTLILISDGGDNQFDLSLNKEQDKQNFIHLVETLKPFNVRIFTIGVGSKEGVYIPNFLYEGQKVFTKLNDELLKVISEASGGSYFASNSFSTSDLSNQVTSLMRKNLQPIFSGSLGSLSDYIIYQEFFQYFLFFALLLLALYIFYPKLPKSKIIPIIILFIPSVIFSVEDFVVMGKADEREKAIQLIQQELLKPHSYYQTQVLLYDLGTLYLKNGNESKAIETFQKISNESTNHLLEYRLFFNLGYAYYQNGVRFSSPLNLKRAFNAMKKAQIALCQWQADIDLAKCESSENIIKATLKIKHELAQFFDKQYLYYENFNYIVIKLLYGLQRLLSFDSLLNNDYYNSFIGESVGEWEKLHEKFKKEFTIFSRQIQSDLADVYSETNKALNLFFTNLKEGQVNENAYLEASKGLKQIFTYLTKEQPYLFFEDIYPFFQAQMNASFYDPYWTRVFSNLIDVFPDQDKAKLISASLKSTQKLDEANDYINARLSLIRADYYLQKQLIVLNPNLSFFVRKIKKWILQLTFIQLYPELFIEEEKNLLDEISNFSQGILQLEQAEVAKRNCHFHPWNEVVPILEKGVGAVERSLQVSNKVEKVFWQDQAISSWNKALDSYESNYHLEGCQKDNVDSPQLSPEVQKAMQELQEMENQTIHSLPANLNKAKEGLRPW